VNNYIFPEKYNGETEVIHYLELLRDVVGFEKIRENVKEPFCGVKIAPYYGCLLLRPSNVMAMDDSENPSVLENLIESIGAENVSYQMRNECCGGYITMEDRNQASKNSKRIIDNAVDCGAEMIVTACPLCKYNLQKNGESPIPVVYFTELLYKALGNKVN